MDELVTETMARRNFSMMLLTIFAAGALALAAAGIYGLMSYTSSRRAHEIGIRVALGARRVDILRTVAGQALALTLVGAVIGVAGALLLTRSMSTLLFGVGTADPATMVATTLILTAVALLASYIPARRAAAMDSAAALRHE